MGEIKHILLTGGNGFLGSFILKKLLEESFVPILLLRENANLWRIKDLLPFCKIYTIPQSGKDYSTLFDLYNIDAIIHTATDYGRNSSLSDLLKTNVLFPIELLENGLKKELKLFINTDSFFAKPEFDQLYLKNYTGSKRILEKLLREFTGEIKIANLRLEHVFGENDSEDKFMTSILKKLLGNESQIELTEGLQKRDFIYAEDVASAYISVLKNLEDLEKYQEFEIGSGISITVRSLIEQMAASTKSTSRLEFGSLPTREGEIKDSYASIKQLEKIGWKPVYKLNSAINNIVKKEKERFGL
jgi:nucleoside-diphosphate-sugar epimerase